MLHQPLSVPASPPETGADMLAATDTGELASGARLLHGQYQIEQPLIAGGFGITYLARDSLDRRVVIKECFPADICERVGGDVRPRGPAHLRTYKAVLRSFLREAHLLARAEHPNIVPVHQVFRENGTAYIAMDFIDGLDLLSLRETAAERVTAAMMRSCLTQALGALQALHLQGILHRDISPDNLIWTTDDRLMLIDFGAACPLRAEATGCAEDAMAVKDGYSPHELYDRGCPARPTADVYALAATLVFLQQGEAPASGPERLAAVSRGEPDPMAEVLAEPHADPILWQTVERALSVLPGGRYQSAEAWLQALQEGPASPRPAAAAVLNPQPCTDAPKEPVAAEEAQPSQPPAPAGEPVLDHRIAALVAATNDEITAGLPRVLRPQAPKDQTAAKPKSQPVDLFGQPVGNLQAWLAEQDGSLLTSRRSRSATRAADAARTLQDDVPPDKPRKSRLSLSRLFGKRGGGTSAPHS